MGKRTVFNGLRNMPNSLNVRAVGTRGLLRFFRVHRGDLLLVRSIQLRHRVCLMRCADVHVPHAHRNFAVAQQTCQRRQIAVDLN
jgi:hypothetical protein